MIFFNICREIACSLSRFSQIFKSNGNIRFLWRLRLSVFEYLNSKYDFDYRFYLECRNLFRDITVSILNFITGFYFSIFVFNFQNRFSRITVSIAIFAFDLHSITILPFWNIVIII